MVTRIIASTINIITVSKRAKVTRPEEDSAKEINRTIIKNQVVNVDK